MLKNYFLISLLISSINCILASEGKFMTAVGWGAKNGLKDVSLAAYPHVSDEDKDDASELILKTFKDVNAKNLPPHKSEIKTDAQLKAHTKRVLKNHSTLLDTVQVKCGPLD